MMTSHFTTLLIRKISLTFTSKVFSLGDWEGTFYVLKVYRRRLTESRAHALCYLNLPIIAVAEMKQHACGPNESQNGRGNGWLGRG